MAGNCYKCTEPCTLKESKTEIFGYPCDQCRRIVCKNSAGLSSSEVRAVVIPTRVMPFYCPSCRESSVQVLLKRVINIEQQIQEQSSNLNGKLVTLEQRIVRMEQTIEANKLMEQRIQKAEQLMESNKHIEKEVNDIKNIMESKSDANRIALDSEEIINEMMERNKRKNNIIIFGIKEQSRDIPHAERLGKDTEITVNILTSLNIEPRNNIKPIRLGKFCSEKHRPIKVVLEDEYQVKNIMKNASSLRSTRNYKNVFVTCDRTPRQLAYYRKLKTELEERQNAGEDCRIKYVNGIPKIIVNPLN